MKIKKSLLFIGMILTNLVLFAQTYVLQPDGVDGKDSAIRSAGMTDGASQSISVYTWGNGGILSLKRSVLEFDLDSFSLDMNLASAKLSLYYNPTDPYEGFDYHSGENSFFVERVTTDWEELDVNWDNQPSTTNVNRVAVSQSEVPDQDFLDIDVTHLVIDMLQDPDNSYGFMLKMQNEEDPYSAILLASSDHPDSSYHPKLELTFDEIPPTNLVNKQSLAIKLYPNPVSNNDKIILETQELDPSKDLKYKIYDILGVTVLEGKINNTIQEINISNLKSSAYFINVYNQQKNNSIIKFIIE